MMVHGDERGQIRSIAKKYYDFVDVFDNATNSYGDAPEYPFRLHVRAGGISNECIFELERAGFKCVQGATCNEWETSVQLKPSSKIKIHPPHMPIKVKAPPELENMAPNWKKFLDKVTCLGHLVGTLNNGVFVPKQAFGDCDTSIVLELYKRVYGEEDYKHNQCNTCINHELGFKRDIDSHDITSFESSLRSFVTHFQDSHPDLYKKLDGIPKVYEEPPLRGGHYSFLDTL